jgi:hypothetical protein
MAPAYVANMSPPLVKYWRVWNRPISPRWLGSHKTVVGFAAGLLGAVVTTLVQHVIGHTAGIVASRATLSLWDLVIVVALSFGGHILINHSAYWLGIRDVKW